MERKPKKSFWTVQQWKKVSSLFSGVHQMPDIAIIKDMDGETYPLIFEKGEISVNIAANKRGGTPLNDSLNIALNRMQLIMDNMLKTSGDCWKKAN